MNRRITLPLIVVTSLCVILSGPAIAWAAIAGPSNVKASSTAGTATASITWTEPGGATRYRIKAFIGNVAVKTSGILVGSRTSFTFTSLEYEIPYVLKVEAGDASSWSAPVSAPSVTPIAASPSAPGVPDLSVIADKQVEATWSEPSSNGGSTITSYSVQLLKGGVAAGDAVVTKATKYIFGTEDKTSQYSVTVKATNSAGKTSTESEASAPVTPTFASAVVVTTTVPSHAGGGNQNGGAGGSPGSPTTTSPTAPNGANSSLTGAAPSQSTTGTTPIQLSQPIAATNTAVSFIKTVALNSRTSKKNLLALSKLVTPKGSKTAYTLSFSSRKYCTLTSTGITAKKTGTCSVKITVTIGKKSSSRTVVLKVGKMVSTNNAIAD